MNFGIATLTIETPFDSKEIRILPPGIFRSQDGRPQNLPGWKIDVQIAARIIAQAAAMPDDLLIDYEHQSLNTGKNGQPVPAAGWFKRMEWLEGKGLCVVDARFTLKAKEMIADGEYRYVSPVFYFDDKTGEVQKIISLGLTNTPALPGLVDLGTVAVNSKVIAPMQKTTERDSDRAIEAFNAAFGEIGMFHPDTPAEARVAMKQTSEKPPFPYDVFKGSPQEIENMKRIFPDAWRY